MRFRLIIYLLLVTAFSAAAQYPVGNTAVYPTLPPAEIHFVDGTVSNYPVLRISKDLIRVDTGNDQSIRMPLTYVESVKFKDGCTLFFKNGQFQFDKLVQPAFLNNESGDVVLEQVLKLDRPQAESLMGPETYQQFRKNSLLMKCGIGAMTGGFILMIPYLGSCMEALMSDKADFPVFSQMGTPLKWVTASGIGILAAGICLSFIGNNGCNRVVATYNDGLGVAYTF